jgi:hypothetical protein
MTVSSWRANRPELSRSLLNPASPQARLDALSTNLIGLGKRWGEIVRRDGASPTSDPISQSSVADVRGPE